MVSRGLGEPPVPLRGEASYAGARGYAPLALLLAESASVSGPPSLLDLLLNKK